MTGTRRSAEGRLYLCKNEWDMETEWDLIVRLCVAGLCGTVIGLDREYRVKDAGFRTHFLVALGSALMMIVSQYGFEGFLATHDGLRLDPSRIAAQVVSGIGFIGAGNMGGALARAACRWRPEQVVLTDRTLDKAVALAEELDCDIAMDNAAVAREAKFIFLGVKPQMMGDMLAALAPTLEERGGGYVLVSMAAGLTIARLEEMLGFEAPILRIMPNTPAAIGEGMILYAANERVAAADVEEFCDKMVGAGRLDRQEERLIDAASSVSGCGPAFVYQFIEALADGGVACGLPRPKAMEYAAQTLVGAAGMVLATGRHPGQLKDEVCSPGGTIAGVYALEKGGMRAAVMSAVLESFEKNKELGKQ